MSNLRLVQPGDGSHHWLLSTLATIKVGPDDTETNMTIAEFEIPSGFAVPPHAHREEDELFYVLDGEVTFWCDGVESTFTRGGLAWLPKRKPHGFAVSETGPARMFNIHTGPQFVGLVEAMGRPAPEARLPEPPTTEPDPAEIARIFDQFGIDLVTSMSG